MNRIRTAIVMVVAATLALSGCAAANNTEQGQGQNQAVANATTTPADAMRIADQWSIGTHDSEHIAPDPSKPWVQAYLDLVESDILFTPAPLAQQLDQGARQIELDFSYTPPNANAIIDGAVEGIFGKETGQQILQQGLCGGTIPGPLNVVHSPIVDCNSYCEEGMTDCLNQINAWSQANPNHLPIMIYLDPKVLIDNIYLGNWIQTHMGTLNDTITSVFGPDKLIKPSDLGPVPRDAIIANGRQAWPTVQDSLGKFMFVLAWYDNSHSFKAKPDDLYQGYSDLWTAGKTDPSKAPAYFFDMSNWNGQDKDDWNQTLFDGNGNLQPSKLSTGPEWAAILTTDEAPDDPAGTPAGTGPKEIAQLVQQGFVVRLRADAVSDTVDQNTLVQKAAIASGAQFIATDWLTEIPNPPGGVQPYMPKTDSGKGPPMPSTFRLPNGAMVGCTPASSYTGPCNVTP